MPCGAIVPVAKFEPEDDADLDSETATDPLRSDTRQDISKSKGQLLLLESRRWRRPIRWAAAPRRDWISVSRFGANFHRPA